MPSDSAPHKFPISERKVDARLAVRSLPKLAPRAYLYADITYDGEDPLLPGPVAVFRDGAFIGNSGLGLLRPGDDVELSFGTDDSVRVTYELVDGERSSEGLIRKDRRIERRYLIKVKNLHKRDIEIAVMDQLPVSADERIEVELLADTTPATETDVEDRRGVLAWTYTYKPGEEREIAFGYAVQYPEKVNVPGF